MKVSAKKPLAILVSSVLAVFLAAGCSSQNSGGETTAVSPEQTGSQARVPDPEALSDLMGELASAATLEEANDIIGSEGEKKNERSYRSPYEPPSIVSITTDYTWNFGDDVAITGTYDVYEVGGENQAAYETKYHSNQVKVKANFSNWDEIEAKLDSAEGLSYEGLVELLGGVQGLKEKTSTTGDVTYVWYNENYGYMWCNVDAEGMCGTTSGWFDH